MISNDAKSMKFEESFGSKRDVYNQGKKPSVFKPHEQNELAGANDMYSTRALFGHPNAVEMSQANFDQADVANNKHTFKRLGQTVMKAKTQGGTLPSVRHIVDSASKESRKRMSILMPLQIPKDVLDSLRIQTLIQKSKELNENDPASQKRMHKMFATFKNIVQSGGQVDPLAPSLQSSFHQAGGYEEGDSLFDEIDIETVKPADVIVEYQKRHMIGQFKA